MSEILPCPFCGTHPDSEEYPANSLMGGGLSIECGKCGACWPRCPNDNWDHEPSDDEIAAFMNQRSAPVSPSLPTPAATPTDSANPPPVESVGPNSTGDA